MTRCLVPPWFNGAFVEEGWLPLNPADRGLLLGDGAFETVGIVHGVAFQLAAHLDRLMDASDVLGLGLARSDVEAGAAAMTARSGGGDAVLRLTATRGPAARGLAANGTPSLMATLAPFPAQTTTTALRLVTANTRRNEHSPASRLKTLSYLDNILAAREAAARGADDALLLNTRGRVACATVANLFMVRDSRLVTPPLEEGVLPGVTRRLILDAFGGDERPLAPEELASADELFLTNSLRLVSPVASIDGVDLPCTGFPRARACRDHLVALIAAECGGPPPVG